MEVRKVCLRATALAGVLAVGSTAAVVASGATLATIRSKTATNYSWSNPTNVNNHSCGANAPTLWRIDEQLTGSSSGDPQEAGFNRVHISGVADTSNGNGFLWVDLSIRSSANGPEIAHEQGAVVLSNQNRSSLGLGGNGTNAANGTLGGEAEAITSGTTSYPEAFAVTNITGAQSYTGGTAPNPLVVTAIKGIMGGGGPTRSQFQNTQNAPGSDDNAGVLIPEGACGNSD